MSYGGNHTKVEGFGQSQCDGEIQAKGKIGFCCDCSKADGSVIMIGGGGLSCSHTGHGIGITGTSEAKFKSKSRKSEYDFANEAKGVPPTNLNSLNLLVHQ